MCDVAATVWICGLSQSGKTTLADGIQQWLLSNDIKPQILDGRFVRSKIGDFLGYSREERIKVSRVMAAMASVLNENNVPVIVTAITPYQESRRLNRSILKNYYEIYMDCPVEVCMQRDATGNYAGAVRGDLHHFIGVDDPFEVPGDTNLRVPSDDLDIDGCRLMAIDAIQHLFR